MGINGAFYVAEDNNGAHASVYFSPKGVHTIIFTDANGHKFFTEEYVDIPVAAVEQAATDWAMGKRELI
jgi:hypothetical protein